MNGSRPRARVTRLMLLAFAAVVFALFVSAGRWQSGRAEQKTAWLAAWQAAIQAPRAQPLADALGMPGEGPLRVSGEVAFDPRQPWLLLDNQRRGAEVGVRAYRIGDAGTAQLLVEFGWLPMPPDRRLPALAPPPAVATLDGLLLPPPSTGLRFVRHRIEASAEPVLLTYLDPPQIGDDLGVALQTRVLRPRPDPAFGFRRDDDPLPNTIPPEQHRGYALQWYGLATAVLVTTALLALRRDRKTSR